MKSYSNSNNKNIFETLSQGQFVKSKRLIDRAIAAYNCLDSKYRVIFNTVFKDQKRFEKFCTVPSSLQGHHNVKHGNLLHTVEVAEHVIDLVKSTPNVDANLVLLAAFLHDCAKAGEYYYSNHNKCWYMTTQGSLVGHKVLNVQWVSVALESVQHQLNLTTVQALMHLLSTVNHVPPWTGIRQPQMHEAFLLSTADRLSATQDIYTQTSTQIGFGNSHPHLKVRPYRIAATQLNSRPKSPFRRKATFDFSVAEKPSSESKAGSGRAANGRSVF